MYGYAQGYYSTKPNAASVEPFSPLNFNPVFWFDYNTYGSGALAGTEKDVTDTYTITPINSAVIGSDGTNNALATNGVVNNYAVSYGNTFQTQLRASHTHVITYKPNTINPAFEVITGSRTTVATDLYNIIHRQKTLRFYVKIGGVNNVFDTGDIMTTTDYYYILVEVQQSGVRIEVNGVNQTLTNSTFTSTLADVALGVNLYTGARNTAGTVDSPTDAYIGDHLLIPSILTTSEKTQLLNYFI